MTEVLFYHLQSHPLEQVLPVLLERCLERGWRALVLTGSEERVAALNAHLWSYRDDSFLPHGTEADGHAAAQPVYLSATFINPNQAQVLFLTDGADCEETAAFIRCVDLFDGNDAAATQAARDRYRRAVAAGFEVTYWQQTERGAWERRD